MQKTRKTTPLSFGRVPTTLLGILASTLGIPLGVLAQGRIMLRAWSLWDSEYFDDGDIYATIRHVCRSNVFKYQPGTHGQKADEKEIGCS